MKRSQPDSARKPLEFARERAMVEPYRAGCGSLRGRALRQQPKKRRIAAPARRKSCTFHPVVIADEIDQDPAVWRPPPDLALDPIAPLDLALHRLDRVTRERIREWQQNVASRHNVRRACISRIHAAPILDASCLTSQGAPTATPAAAAEAERATTKRVFQFNRTVHSPVGIACSLAAGKSSLGTSRSR